MTPTAYGRGGLLPMAVFLTQNSPGLRTSPVKRGYWVVQRVLGEVIPPPPPVVPELPQDEAKMRPAAPRNAGRASRQSGLRRLPRRVRFLRPGVRRLRPDRRARAPRILPDARSTPRRLSPAAARASASQGLRDVHPRAPAERFRRQSLPQAAGLRAWTARCMLSDEPLVEQMQTKLAARRRIASTRWSKPSSPVRSF